MVFSGFYYIMRLLSTDTMPVVMGAFESGRKKRSSAGRHSAGFRAPGAKILVTDDVSINLKVITMLLKDTEICIDTATSGKECIEKYTADHYDLVFLDHMMPEMDGIETLKHLMETDRYKEENTPVIALTANAMMGAEKTYLESGFIDYLTKPAKDVDLEAMIIKHLPENIKVIYNE